VAGSENFIPIVKAVVSELSPHRSIRDVQTSETLRQSGILPGQVPEIEIRLFRTVGGRDSEDHRRFFSSLSITPDSSIGQIAGRFAHASAQLSKPETTGLQENPTEPWGIVDTAVRTAVAEMSRTHSIGEIRSHQTLGELGLDEADVVDVKTNIYRMFRGPTVRPRLSEFLNHAEITADSTVGDAVKLSRQALTGAMDNRTTL